MATPLNLEVGISGSQSAATRGGGGDTYGGNIGGGFNPFGFLERPQSQFPLVLSIGALGAVVITMLVLLLKKR